MAYLKVLNVRQGDCMVIRPITTSFAGELLFVDLGNEKNDISREIRGQENVRFILTHSHRDHIGGIENMFEHMGQVKEIVLPYCFNEICLISKAILHLRGMQNLYGGAATKKAEEELSDVLSLQKSVKDALGDGGQHVKVTFAYEGMPYADEMYFLNPPLRVLPENWHENAAVKLTKEKSELFDDDFAEFLKEYVREHDALYNGERHDFCENVISEGESGKSEHPQMAQLMRRAGAEIVLRFVSDNFDAMLEFNNSLKPNSLKKILSAYEMKAHDTCLVMMVKHDDTSYLLSGDASKNVFHRLLAQNISIKADIFKVPHHGSKNNLDMTILKKVDPKIAVISHDNGKFGRARDPHPNKEVLSMLERSGVRMLFTNDVKKDGVTVFEKEGYMTYALELE